MAQGRPGRPKKADSAKAAPTGRRRKDRAKLGGDGRLKLSAPEIPGYVTRTANDVDTRLYDLTELDDWEFVHKDEIGNQFGEHNVTPGNRDLGTRVSRVVGTDKFGKPIYGYLLKKKKQFWNEDRKEKFKRVDETEETLKRAKGVENADGSIKFGS